MIYTKSQLEDVRRYVLKEKQNKDTSIERKLIFMYLENLTNTALVYCPEPVKRVDALFDRIDEILGVKL